MADDAARSSRLGRGLAALMGDVGTETNASERGNARAQRRVPIEYIRANPRNPRRTFSDDELVDLTNSIRERGIIQPIVVRPVRGANDAFEIIAGERRWRAAQRAGLHDVPIVLLDVNDAEALELAIIENVQRSDLNPIEEAMGYEALGEEFGHGHDDIARVVGKSRSHVTNMLRLLKLSDPVKAYIRSGKLSAGHARALIGQPNALELAEDIVSRGLNVRQVEEMARKDGAAQARAKKAPKPGKTADIVSLEKRLSDALGLQVSIEHRGDAGALTIRYTEVEQLDEVLRRLERS
jgi:ParB family chromosome partitioning protein